MSSNGNEDEIPLTLSSPAISETKAKFESLLRAAINHNPKEKEKVKNVDRGREKRKCKGRAMSAQSSSLDSSERTDSSSNHYGSTSHLLASDDLSGSIEEETALGNTSEENSVFQIQKKEHNKLVVTPNKYKERNNFIVNGRADVSKGSSNGFTDHVEHDASKLEGSFDSENSSCTVDSKNLCKKPVPLPRIRTKSTPKVLSSDKSDDESGTDTYKQFVVEALVSADSMASSSVDQNGLRGTGTANRKLKLQSSVEIEMLKIDSMEKKSSMTRPKVPCRNKKKSKMTEKRHIDESEKEEIMVDSVVSNSCSSIDSSEKPKLDDHSESVNLESSPYVSNSYKYEKIVGIFIHRSDRLLPDPLVQHPVVKVHLMLADTGQYLKKSSLNRSVSFFNENKSVDFILPLITESYNILQKRSIIPCWEELIVFNEDIEYILNPEMSVIIFFEILDFVNFSLASARYKTLGSEGGWYKIAWAFLKPVGKNGACNTEKKVRLQLYRPHTNHSFSSDSCEPYVWWHSGQWDCYPGSLYVTVKGIQPPDNLQPALRSRSALQSEHSSCYINIEPTGTEHEPESMNATSLPVTEAGVYVNNPSWSRLLSQSCKVPNRRAFTFATPSKGCFTVKFSPSGLLLACAIESQDVCNIVILTIPEGKEYMQLSAHQGLIYDLHWSHNDSVLLSASADCTVCIWDVRNKKMQPSHMLPHPSFVYCAQFHPDNSHVLITGCCDSVVRVWIRSRKTKQYDLSQELEGPAGFVSTLCFDKHYRVFSGDSEGKICMWHTGQSKQTHHLTDWELEKEMNVRELRSTVINKLVAHPGGQRLLVHARDSLLRMLDIGTGIVVQWFKGALNHRVQTSACISPCGSLVWAASEDGTVWVWNTDTGEQVATYTALGFDAACTGVDYHPHEHMVAMCSYGCASHIVVCDHDRSCSGSELGLLVHAKDYTRDCSRLGNGVLHPTSLPPLAPLPSVKKKTDPMEIVGGSSQSQGGLPPLSHPVCKHENSDSVSMNAHSFQGENKLAKILEKIDQVLSLPSVHRCPADGNLVQE